MMLVASRREARARRGGRGDPAPAPGPARVHQRASWSRGFQQAGFTYFRQISAVLTTITLFFGFLLITVLLTVSVNQRLGEIAALRALGFSRARVVADVLCAVGADRRHRRPAVAAARPRARRGWLDAILKRDARHPGDAALLRLRAAGARRCTARCSPSTAVLAALTRCGSSRACRLPRRCADEVVS